MGGRDSLWKQWPLIAVIATGLLAWGAMSARVDALEKENNKTVDWLIRIDAKIDALRKDLFDALVKP